MIVADVYKADVLAGHLERYDDRVEFGYIAGYSGAPVASTLPVGSRSFAAPAGQLPAFFVGLLPEGRRLSALRRTLKVSADDELSLLLAVGGDTIGDVRVLPSGKRPTPVPALVQADSWSDVDLGDLFARSIGPEYDRTAIPGIQDKISGRMLSFPAQTEAGPVIVKLNPPEYRDLVRNENLMLDVANETSLEVPAHRLVVDGSGVDALVVGRFDRCAGDLLPVEDGCQALGRYPADKYNLDTIEVIAGLAALCSAPIVAKLQLLERFLLSYVIGDGDLHARNLSVYRSSNGLWMPTPVYDLVCTSVYGDTTLAAPFNGRDGIRQMGRNRFVAAGIELGLKENVVAAMLGRVVPKVAAAVTENLTEPTFAAFPDRAKTIRLVKRRAELLLT